MRAPQDSAGRAIAVGDCVTWRGQFYTIKSFGDPIGRHGTRAIEFEEPLHIQDEVPDEIAVDLVNARTRRSAERCGEVKPCTNHTPPWFVGHWRDWHRGHGCERDDGKPRSDEAKTEVAQHAENLATDFLTDAELSFLRASTTAGNELLVRALDELLAWRSAAKVRGLFVRTLDLSAAKERRSFDHSARTTKHFEPLLGFCICEHCAKLPDHDTARESGC